MSGLIRPLRVLVLSIAFMVPLSGSALAEASACQPLLRLPHPA
jgi:hypothetical protein